MDWARHSHRLLQPSPWPFSQCALIVLLLFSAPLPTYLVLALVLRLPPLSKPQTTASWILRRKIADNVFLKSMAAWVWTTFSCGMAGLSFDCSSICELLCNDLAS